jgi:hypothetical protein
MSLLQKQQSKPPNDILSLSHDLFKYIFSPFLNLCDIASLSTINKAYHVFILEHVNWSQREYIPRNKDAFDSFISSHKPFTLGKIDLSNITVTQDIIISICRLLPELKKFKLCLWQGELSFDTFKQMEILEWHGFLFNKINLY